MATHRMNAAEAVLQPSIDRGLGNHPALLLRDRSLTYLEVSDGVNRVGNGLRSQGVERENRVLLMLKDSPELVFAYLGVMKIGAVAVALNVRSAPADLLFAINDSRCKFLIIDHEFLPIFHEIAAAMDEPPKVIVAGPPNSEFPTLSIFMASQSPMLAAVPMAPDDMAFWIYTSGTTGTPKAAVHLQHDVLTADRYLGQMMGVTTGDRLFATSKLFFAYSLGCCLFGAFRLGATTILHDGWPDSAAIEEIVRTHRPTVMLSVPTMYRNMLRDGIATPETFQSVRCFVSAGERLPKVLFDRWQEATGAAIYDGIGTSETIYMFLANAPEAIRAGSSGRPVPGGEVELRDEQGRCISEPGKPGVLWVSMPSTCDRYWNQQDRSHAAFHGRWFCTGDMFVVDQDGWWHHEGRSDDMLKISGQWVSPAEVEEHVLKLPQVAEAAVIGAPNADGLVRLCLFIVLSATESGDVVAEIQAALTRSLSIYKCPRDVRFVDEVPRTATGKVQRFRLRQQIVESAA